MELVTCIARAACGKGLWGRSLHAIFKEAEVRVAEADSSGLGQQVLKPGK